MQTEVRHLLLYNRAYKDRVRREEAHVLGLRNDIRQWMGGEAIDPYGSSSSSPSQEIDKDEAARHQLLRETSFEDCEQVDGESFNQKLGQPCGE